MRRKLELHYRDMQDIEFTIQKNRLYMLQTRNGKRTAAASLRMAVEMAREGLIDQAEAVRRVNPAALDQLLHPTLDPQCTSLVVCERVARQPGCRVRCRRVQRRRGGVSRGQGRDGNPGTRRDESGGYSWHARGARHHYRSRRHDQPCRRGGTRHGSAMRGRSGRYHHGLQRPDHAFRRHNDVRPAISLLSMAGPGRSSLAACR